MNTTTLNVVSLDDGRILKKGGATPNPPSGGDVLEGEYYLARPNGWYWKYVGDKIITTDNPLYNMWLYQGMILLACDGLYSFIDNRYYELPFVWMLPEVISMQIKEGQNIDFSSFVGYAEKAVTYSSFGLIGESLYEISKTSSGQEISEADFEAMMLSDYKLQRITKEEYESLITA